MCSDGAKLEPFGITRFCTGHWGTCTRHLDIDEHQLGKLPVLA